MAPQLSALTEQMPGRSHTHVTSAREDEERDWPLPPLPVMLPDTIPDNPPEPPA